MSWQIPSLLSAVVGCCCSCFAALLEQLTKFSVIRMAMSGQGFWDASYDVIAMMRRDGLDAYRCARAAGVGWREGEGARCAHA